MSDDQDLNVNVHWGPHLGDVLATGAVLGVLAGFFWVLYKLARHPIGRRLLFVAALCIGIGIWRENARNHTKATLEVSQVVAAPTPTPVPDHPTVYWANYKWNVIEPDGSWWWIPDHKWVHSFAPVTFVRMEHYLGTDEPPHAWESSGKQWVFVDGYGWCEKAPNTHAPEPTPTVHGSKVRHLAKQ